MLTILLLSPWFSIAQSTYTLTDEDVVVTDGIIISCSYDFTIKDIIIPEILDGQTVIGIIDKYNDNPNVWDPGVFYEKNIVSIKFPASLKYIGAQAFLSNQLTNLTIPKSVTSVGKSAFQYNKLTSVILEDNSNILSIERIAFSNNSELSSIKLPLHANSNFIEYLDNEGKSFNPGDNITDFSLAYRAVVPYTLTNNDVVINNGYIESCSYNFAFKDIIIPETIDGQTVTGIADNFNDGVFGAKNIISIQFPSTLEYIGASAFRGNNLSTLTIPDNVTAIGRSAFDNNKLTSITIPNSVTSIGNSTFTSNNITSLIIPNSVTSIGDEAFLWNQLTNVTFEANSNIGIIGKDAFKYNWELLHIVLPTHASQSFVIYKDDNGNSYSPGDTISDFSTNYYTIAPHTLTDEDVVVTNGIIVSCNYNFSIKDIIIPSILDGQTVTGINTFDFREKGLNSIQLPARLQVIGDFAFAHDSLSQITIPNSVTTIGNAAFYGNKLTSLNLPNSLTSIGEMAFQQNRIESLSIPNSVKFIGGSAFAGNRLTNLTIPDSVTSISALSFAGNNLTSVTIPDAVTSIGGRAFMDNKLTSVDIPNSITSIDYEAFYKNNLTNLSIPNSVTNIGEMAFFENRLTSVSIPNSVTFIGYSAFNNNQISEYNNTPSKGIIYKRKEDGSEDYSTIISYGGISDIIDFIPNAVSIIGKEAFKTNNLIRVTIPKSIVSIGSHAFFDNNLKSVEFEANSNIKQIDFMAFEGNSELISIVLPTHANSTPVEYQDNWERIYSEGDLITDFRLSYETVIKTKTERLETKTLTAVLYPNPTKEKMNLKISGMPLNETVDVVLLNVHGVIISQRHFPNSEKISFNLSEQPGGLYFVKITTPNNKIVKKLILDKN